MSETIAGLENHGYKVIPEHKGLRAGLRVCNAGEQYYEAITKGTATVVAVMRNEGSFWEQKYRAPDVEVIVRRDRDGSEGQWANYGTHIASEQPSAQEDNT